MKVEEFGEQAVGMQGFRAFAFMNGKSPYIRVGHNIGVFFDIGNTAALGCSSTLETLQWTCRENL